ncbi:hypothetical protein ACQKP7_17440, partial [Pseudomonas frederiksbergensis]
APDELRFYNVSEDVSFEDTQLYVAAGPQPGLWHLRKTLDALSSTPQTRPRQTCFTASDLALLPAVHVFSDEPSKATDEHTH